MALYRLRRPHFLNGRMVGANAVVDMTREQAFSKGAGGSEVLSPHLEPLGDAPSGPTKGPEANAGARDLHHADARDHPDFASHTLASQADAVKKPSLEERIASLEARLDAMDGPVDMEALAKQLSEGVRTRLQQLFPNLKFPEPKAQEGGG